MRNKATSLVRSSLQDHDSSNNSYRESLKWGEEVTGDGKNFSNVPPSQKVGTPVGQGTIAK
jgi:hypothetical protein